MKIHLLIVSILFVYVCTADHITIQLERARGLAGTRRGSKRSDVALATDGLAFVAPVTIGTPPRSFKLHVDTGSTLTAVPITGCTNCDQNTPDTHYSPSSSSSATAVECSSVCSSQQCSANGISNSQICPFTVTYGLGSIEGTVYQDTFSIGGYSAVVDLGAISQSTADFEAPEADGIMGLAYNSYQYTAEVCCSTSVATPVYDSLVASNSNLTDIFALRFTDIDGILTLGGYDESLLDGPINYSPVVVEAFYQLSLSAVSLGDSYISQTPTNVIIDSGTSFIIFPVAIYANFKSYLQTYYSNIPMVTGAGSIFDKECYPTSKYNSEFPVLNFTFSGATVSLPPDSYIILTYNSRGSDIWCLAVSEQTSADEPFILGTPIFRHNYVIFDRVKNRIGFGSSTYSPITSVSANLAPFSITIFFIVFSTILHYLA